MIKRRYTCVLGTLLLALMLCSLSPVVYADAGLCTCGQEMDPRCACGCNAAPVLSREELLERFLSCLFEAEDERDSFIKAHLYEKAQELWDTYLDAAYTELDASAAQPSREDLFAAFLDTVSAAESEHDPERRAALYEQAELLWDAYLHMEYAETEPGWTANDPFLTEGELCYPEDVCRPEMYMIIGGSDGPTVLFVTENINEIADPKEIPHSDEYADAYLENTGSAEKTEPTEGENVLNPEFAELSGNELTGYLVDQTADMFCDNGNWAEPPVGSSGIPNPWTQTDDLSEAVLISGVDFCPPADDSMPQDMQLMFYRAASGVLEADYTNGEEELVLRASTEDEGYILSGDYNTYSCEWKENIDGVIADCLGDGEHINVAAFKSGDMAYAMTMVCGREGVGLTADELAELVKATLSMSDTDIYADHADIYADPKAQESPTADDQPGTEKNGETIILFTGNVRCGIEEGFSYAGLKALRDALEAQGYTTILADGGNAVQGEVLGAVSKGMAVIDFMNALGYQVAIPGGHEFDYGLDRFRELAKAADYPYISCNLTCEGERALEPFVMIEANGKKIAFIGATLPADSEMPVQSGFANEAGDAIIGFMQDASGETVCSAVQSAVDSARVEGADLVCVLGNIGADENESLLTAAELIANTTGIDVFFDSAGNEMQTVKDKMGDNVACVPSGEKLSGIGFTRIASDGSIAENGVWRWPGISSAAAVFDVNNDITEMTQAALQRLNEELGAVVTFSDASLTDAGGETACRETKLGDFCADALRVQSGADIGMINAGLIRAGINSGEIRYGDVLRVFPESRTVRVIELSGQQLLDTLEWGCRTLPEASDSFPQVSGLRFEIRTDIDSPCVADILGGFSIQGERRVKNVLVNGEPVESEKLYTLACPDAMLKDYPAFLGVQILEDWEKEDVQVLIDYIIDDLDGIIVVAEQGRILSEESVSESDPGGDEDIYLTESDLAVRNEPYTQIPAEKAA